MIPAAGAMKFVVERSYAHSNNSILLPTSARYYNPCTHSDVDVFHAQDICIKTDVNYSYGQDVWEKAMCNGTHVRFASYSDGLCSKPLNGPLYPQPMVFPAQKCFPYGNVSSNVSNAAYSTYECNVEFEAVVKEVGNDGTFKYTPAEHCMKTAFWKYAKFSCQYCKVVQTTYGADDENCTKAVDHNQTPHWRDLWTCCEDSVPEAQIVDGLVMSESKKAILQDRTTYDKLQTKLPLAWIGCTTLVTLCMVLRVVLAFRAGRERDSAVGTGDTEVLFPQ